jgi:hypothetical protein
MSYPLSRADLYRKVAAEFSDLAKSASSDFSRGYYQRTAERYQSLAEGETSAQPDESIPIQPASSPPSEMEPKPEAGPEGGNGKGASHIVRKLARRVARLASRPAS